MTSTSIVLCSRAQQMAPRYHDDSYLTLTRLSIDTTAEACRSRSSTRNSDLTYADPLVVVCQPGPRPSHERLSRSLPPLPIRGTTQFRWKRSATLQPSPPYVTTSNIVAIRQPVSARYSEKSDASVTIIESSTRSHSHSRDPSPVHAAPSNTVTVYRASTTQSGKRSTSQLRPPLISATADSRRSSSTSSFRTGRDRTEIGGPSCSPWLLPRVL